MAAARKLRQDVYVTELYLDRLYKHELKQVRSEALPRFPGVERDFSFLFDDAVSFERIHQAVDALNLPELRGFEPVEVFRGEKLGAGKYSVLVRVTFQAADRTLRDDEVATWSEQMIQALEAFGGAQRA